MSTLRADRRALSGDHRPQARPADPAEHWLRPEALAAVVTAKYCDALPLYRQVDILARGGLNISRSNLASWFKAGELVEPLRQAMQQHLLKQGVICADENPGSGSG